MSDTQRIKDNIDIVDLVGEYTQLKPAGINHKACCPFHQEKSPSFMVNRERQSWHCFGCGKGGDIFSFIQEIEGMEFIDALKLLATRAGVPLDSYENTHESSQKSRIKEINEAAARFFHKFLLEMPGGQDGRVYLTGRGLRAETIDEWHIGFIPDQWDLLTQYLIKKGSSIDDLVASGLTIKRDGAVAGSSRGFYDRFRGRVMFPIWDVHGTVVGFTGRVLVETEHSGGKYVNTPQTLVYDKSRVVFGLNKAKQEIKAKDVMVMVEGQMDVIACHQAGMKHVVATSGTALTEHQVHLLKRYASTIAIAFDADAAGQAAAKRGIDIALEAGLNVRVIRIPDGKGKDADECLKKNPEVWFQAVQDAQDIMAWYVEKAFRNRDTHDPKAKQQIANDILPEIARIPFAVERDHWLRIVEARLGVDTAVLREDMERLGKKKESGEGKEKKLVVEMNSIDPDPSTATPLGILVERFFVLLFRFPGLAKNIDFTQLDRPMAASSRTGLYDLIKKEYTSIASVTIPHLREILSTGNGEQLVDILLMKGELDFSGFTDKEAKEELLNIVSKIQLTWVKEERKRIQMELASADARGDIDGQKKLLEEFKKI